MPRPHHHRFTSCVLAFVLPALTSNLLAADDLQYPDTPAGRTLQALLSAFNSGDVSTLEQFEATQRSPEQLAEQSASNRALRMLQATGIMGDITASEVVESEPLKCAVLATCEKLPMQLVCRVTLDEAAPHYLNELEIVPAPAKKAASTDWAKAEWTTLDELLSRAVEATGIPAISVVVMQGDEIVDEAAVGVRVAGEDAAVTLEDRFHVGSITKTMTATLIARLIEQGKLDWDTTLVEALPGVAMRPEYRDVTIAQLLQHRAGLPQALPKAPYAARGVTDLVRLRALHVAAAMQAEPLGPAGETWEYSNLGYTVAGHIAEVAAGRPWEALMRTEVFDPFGMDSAGLGWPHLAGSTDQPRGHVAAGDAFAPAPSDYGFGPDKAPAGDTHCTMRDLAKFARQHLKGLQGKDGPLSATTFRRLHTPLGATPDIPSDYACGWGLRMVEGVGEVHRHNGSGGTFLANMEIHVDRDRVVVIAMNVGLAGREVITLINRAIARHFGT